MPTNRVPTVTKVLIALASAATMGATIRSKYYCCQTEAERGIRDLANLFEGKSEYIVEKEGTLAMDLCYDSALGDGAFRLKIGWALVDNCDTLTIHTCE